MHISVYVCTYLFAVYINCTVKDVFMWHYSPGPSEIVTALEYQPTT